MPKTCKSSSVFLTEHATKYGLKIIERSPNTGDVVSVRCQFCIYYGAEDSGKPRQRAKKDTKMTWTNSFRTDLYQKHHRHEHPNTWIMYQASSYDEKIKFFETKTPVGNTILRHVNQTGNPLRFDINASIVDTLIGDMFFHPDDHGEVTQKTALNLFQRKESNYEVTISNPMQFQLIVSKIAKGVSFRQIRTIMMEERMITGASNRLAR